MRLFGLEITRVRGKAAPLTRVGSERGWWPVIRESYTGAWQSGVEVRPETVLTYSALYACVTLIASDVAKMRVKLVERDATGIWSETESAAFSPVLRKPNTYQNRIKFYEYWLTSKLLQGNTYVLKQRDARGIVIALYLLDPLRVGVLVAPDGSVFYELSRDVLSGVTEDRTVVPAREIIHDVMVPLFHPLVGVTPIYACGLAAVQGLKIQQNSTRFFAQGSQPGGVLTAPGFIKQETADRMKTYWEENFSGNNVGRVAVLGDGLKYEPMTVKAADAQLIEQLKWTGEDVCAAFHVPAYLAGVGPPPSYNNIEALNQQYYSQCLQAYIEALELCLDEGLELPKTYGTEFDLDDLFRMDSATKMEVATKGVAGAVLTPNEARAKFNRKPLAGGDTAYLQQQYYSLAALNKRDQAGPPPPTPAAPAAAAARELDAEFAGRLETALRTRTPRLRKELEDAAA